MKTLLSIATGLMLLFSSAIAQTTPSTHKDFFINISIQNIASMPVRALQSTALTPLSQFPIGDAQSPPYLLFTPRIGIAVIPGTNSVTYGYDQNHFCKFVFTVSPNGNISFQPSIAQNVKNCDIRKIGSGRNTVVAMTIESIPQTVDKNFVPYRTDRPGLPVNIRIKNNVKSTNNTPLPLQFHRLPMTSSLSESQVYSSLVGSTGTLPDIPAEGSQDLPEIHLLPGDQITLFYGLNKVSACTFKIVYQSPQTGITVSVSGDNDDDINGLECSYEKQYNKITLIVGPNWRASSLCVRNNMTANLLADYIKVAYVTDGVAYNRYTGKSLGLGRKNCYDYIKNITMSLYQCTSRWEAGDICYHIADASTDSATPGRKVTSGLISEITVSTNDGDTTISCNYDFKPPYLKGNIIRLPFYRAGSVAIGSGCQLN